MLVKKMKIWSIAFVAVFALVLTSCEKETETTTTTTETDNYTTSVTDSLRGGKKGGKCCFELVYPVTIKFADETTASVDSKEAMKEAIKNWFTTNNADKTRANRPTLVLPVTVTKDGQSIEVTTEEQLKELKASCRPKGGKGHKGKGHYGGRKCFEFVFPISITFADGSTVAVNSIEEKRDTIRAWFETNNVEKTEENRPKLVFPIKIKKDDKEVEVASLDELKELTKDCRGGKGHHGRKKCFKLVFPLSMNIGGAVQSFDDAKVLKKALHEYRKANGRDAERPSFVFPIKIELEDGSQVEVADEEALKAQKEACNN